MGSSNFTTLRDIRHWYWSRITLLIHNQSSNYNIEKVLFSALKLCCYFWNKNSLTSVSLLAIFYIEEPSKAKNWESCASIYKGLFQNERPVQRSLSKARKKNRRVLSTLDKRERTSSKVLEAGKNTSKTFLIYLTQTFYCHSDFHHE